MMAWFPLTSLAFAHPPPLVQWTGAAVEQVNDEEDADPTPLVNAAAPQGFVELEPIDAPLHGWLDESSFALAIGTRGGQLYHLRATLRHADFVAHWTQGPYFGTNESLPVTLEVPTETASALAQLGAESAILTVNVLSTTMEGKTIAQQRVGRTALTSHGGVLQRAPLVPTETSEEP